VIIKASPLPSCHLRQAGARQTRRLLLAANDAADATGAVRAAVATVHQATCKMIWVQAE